MSWKEQTFNKDMCQGVVTNNGYGDINIKGFINNNIPDTLVVYWAPSPPTYLTSYSGSGLPYPNADVAYSRTPNSGAVKTGPNGDFSFNLKYPNSYYVRLGTLYVPPQVNIKICQSGMDDKYSTIQLGEGIPYRTLTYPAPPSKKPRISPLFYHEPKDLIRSQEQILRESAYPSTNTMPDNFWGLKPPM
jgi:hypothetical protein